MYYIIGKCVGNYYGKIFLSVDDDTYSGNVYTTCGNGSILIGLRGNKWVN